MSAVLEARSAVQPGDERVSIYQPEPSGLIFPGLPKFTSIAQER